MKRRHQNCNNCVECRGENAKLVVQKMIETIGTAAIFVGGEFCYTVGLSQGKPNGIEFYIGGLGQDAINSIVGSLKQYYPRICEIINGSGNLKLITVTGCLLIKGGINGSMSFTLVDQNVQNSRCTMFERYYGHSKVRTYRVYICDDQERTVSDPNYDVELLKVSNM